MPYIRDSFWRGRDFTSLAEMQTAAIDWCLGVAGARHHRSLEGPPQRVPRIVNEC
jgi:hypothetical protein